MKPLDFERAKTDLAYAVNTLVPELHEKGCNVSFLISPENYWCSFGSDINSEVFPKNGHGPTPSSRMADALVQVFQEVVGEH